MFGSGRDKEKNVRLTEREIRELTKNMTRSERREFERKQERARADREWDEIMLFDLFEDE